MLAVGGGLPIYISLYFSPSSILSCQKYQQCTSLKNITGRSKGVLVLTSVRMKPGVATGSHPLASRDISWLICELRKLLRPLKFRLLN